MGGCQSGLWYNGGGGGGGGGEARVRVVPSPVCLSDLPSFEVIAGIWVGLCVEWGSTNTAGTSMFMMMKISTHIKV